MSYLRATRVLCWLLGVAVAVSVVHYVDNYVNYDDYPVPAPDAAVPAPSATLVAVGWFVFTAFGGVGLLLWFRRHITSAAVALTGYSVSGLVGIAHYTVPGAVDMVWWRQLHVVTDIVCGAAVLGFALWAARHSDELIPPGARTPPPAA
ncbi:MAG TPA: hypothetical protein VNT31_11430 [Nocardioides sp.]|nr:hypothetical protein [Nocardioides sp.]